MRVGEQTKRLFRYAHCMQRGAAAAAHLPLEIVRSGTASFGSILPQGQVSHLPHPVPHPASMHINADVVTTARRVTYKIEPTKNSHQISLFYRRQILSHFHYPFHCYSKINTKTFLNPGRPSDRRSKQDRYCKHTVNKCLEGVCLVVI